MSGKKRASEVECYSILFFRAYFCSILFEARYKTIKREYLRRAWKDHEHSSVARRKVKDRCLLLSSRACFNFCVKTKNWGEVGTWNSELLIDNILPKLPPCL